MDDLTFRKMRSSWTGEDLREEDFLAIMDLLRARRDFRLDQYKDGCMRRRVAKRLRAARVDDLAAYLERLHHDDEELDALLNTLSIHVSRFFRNPETFRTLERHILPDLCRRALTAGRDVLRLWSAGCAGGEEAYSLALLLNELKPAALRIDILGTDVSSHALDMARLGCYRPERLTEVPAATLKRYFVPEGNAFQLVEGVRDMVRFERHNIMSRETFPKVDLILCRNVLIYFSRVEQERILTRFSEALSPEGVLVLGRSEALVGAIRSAYRSEYPVERIYRCIS